MTASRAQSGFSLIELIIYVALVSIIVTGFVSFAIDLAASSQKAKVQLQVQQNARFAMETILREIRQAQGLDELNSTFGAHPGAITLEQADPLNDPTVIDVENGILRIMRGAQGTEEITDESLEITDLVFENLSTPGRVQVLRVALTLRHANPDQSEIFEADSTLYGTAVIRTQQE